MLHHSECSGKRLFVLRMDLRACPSLFPPSSFSLSFSFALSLSSFYGSQQHFLVHFTGPMGILRLLWNFEICYPFDWRIRTKTTSSPYDENTLVCIQTSNKHSLPPIHTTICKLSQQADSRRTKKPVRIRGKIAHRFGVISSNKRLANSLGKPQVYFGKSTEQKKNYKIISANILIARYGRVVRSCSHSRLNYVGFSHA